MREGSFLGTHNISLWVFFVLEIAPIKSVASEWKKKKKKKKKRKKKKKKKKTNKKMKKKKKKKIGRL